MGQLPIPIPLYAEQQQIATYLDIKCSKIDYIIAAQKKKIAYLQELKQSLIANVVTGKIKVNAERKSKVDDNTAKMQSIKWLGV